MMQHFSTSSFVAGIMLGVLLAGAWFLDGTIGLISAPSSSFLATTTTSSLLESGAVSVANQPAGESVIVASVTVPSSGVWVAVREVNDNTLGNVLGAARVASPHDTMTISLLRATEPNRSYAVELYRDDNNSAFDPSVNSVYVDFDTGTRVVAYFTTTE